MAISARLGQLKTIKGKLLGEGMSAKFSFGLKQIQTVATKTELGSIIVGENLSITEDGVLSVETTSEMGPDNTKPITAAGVAVQVGNIEALLETI